MSDLPAALRLVDQALLTQQIGTPVAVRILAHQQERAAGDPPSGVWALETASRWLRDQPLRTISQRAAGGDHETRLVMFAGGKTALLSTGSGPGASGLLQLVVFGSRGIVCRHDGQEAAALSGPPAVPRGRAATRDAQAPPYGVLLVSGEQTHQPMYADALLADSRCRLVGVTDAADVTPRRRALNAQLARRLNVPLLADLDTALADKDVHIVSVCAEPARRGPLIARAALAGKHLYLDKPLAGSLADVDRAVAAIRQSGVLAHMFSGITSETVARIRAVVDSGRLGRLLAVHCDYCFAKGPAGTAALGTPRRESEQPRSYEVVDAKRELTNVGVYPLVMLLSILGRQPVRVAATTGNYFFAEHQARDMEDFGQLVVEFEDGVLTTCTTGRTGWQSHPRDGLNRTCLVGSQATAVVDAYTPRLEVWSDAPSWTPPPRNPEDPMGMWVVAADSPFAAAPKPTWLAPPFLSPVDDVKYFLDCLEQGQESEVSAEIAAAASQILLAAYRSAAAGEAVCLPLPRHQRTN
jgi:predicted dehydrogenase